MHTMYMFENIIIWFNWLTIDNTLFIKLIINKMYSIYSSILKTFIEKLFTQKLLVNLKIIYEEMENN